MIVSRSKIPLNLVEEDVASNMVQQAAEGVLTTAMQTTFGDEEVS
jgi:hypothetical protein